ncbi:hypothetical protein JXA32_05525 [Candidatus Sumerlaeota bacterium]|nr:hypothetical protein [Candidatus Sumerlaeota bacterium]
MSSRTRVSLRARKTPEVQKFLKARGEFQAEGFQGVDLAAWLGCEGVEQIKETALQNPGWLVEEKGNKIHIMREIKPIQRTDLQNINRLRIHLEGERGHAGMTVRSESFFGVEVTVREDANQKMALENEAQSQQHKISPEVAQFVNLEVNSLIAETIARQVEEKLKLKGKERVQIREREVVKERTIRINAFCASGW